jgi:protein-disulfide isomerase
MWFLKLCSGMGLTFAMVILGCGSSVAQTESGVVAQIGAEKITARDLEQEESAKLLQARNTYYQAQSKALEDLIEKKLIEQKAKSENLTVSQLIDRDIKSKVQDPTDDQMKVYYEGLGTDQSYESVRDKILEKIRQVRADRIQSAYINKLRERTTVVVTLTPPTANVQLANANTLGSKTAPVMLVEFADYECPYCQKVAADIQKLQTDFGGKVAVTFKDFPLPMHAHAEKAAEAVRCAGKQGKYWEMHDQVFHSKQLDVDQLKTQARALELDGAQFDQCVDSGETAAAVQQDRQEGVQLGLSGTPSFFINGHFFSGALDYSALKQIIDQQLAQPAKTAPVTAQK